MIPAFNYAAPVPAPAPGAQSMAMPMPMAASMAVPMAAPVAAGPMPHHVPIHRGTLPPGTKVVVGKHMVVVQRYLAEGGFAHVYLVNSLEPISIPSVDSHGRKTMRPETTHVLKRMAVPDKDTLALVRGEVEAHRLLHGHTHIVHFIEASATALQSGGYEVFILMEYCSGGGIIDLMNKRLRDRLRESEVLKIFGDVCEGLAVMHHLDPPLMHRDLKIENVLICPPPADDPALGPVYKLADFGSASPVLRRRPPKSIEEIKRVEADLNRSTTMQYRAPEMVDVCQRRVIDEKADIWAMGVFLYKLCYYTTPFEENGGGPLAILNARYRFPPSPVYSQNLKNLIASMLQEHSDNRPTIDQMIVRVYELRGLAPPAAAQHYSRLAQEGKQLSPLPSVVTRERTVRRASAQPSSLDDSVVNLHHAHKPKPDYTTGEIRSGTGRLVLVDTDDAMREEDLAALRKTVQPMRRGRPTKEPPAPVAQGVHNKPSPGLEATWPGMRKTRPYSTIGTVSRSPAGDGSGDSFEPSSSHNLSVPTQGVRSPSPSEASPSSSLVPPSFIDEAPSRYPSLDELNATSPAHTGVAARAKQFERAPSPPTYGGQPLAYQPRRSTTVSKTHTPRKSSVLDRWSPANENKKEEAIRQARSKLAAEPPKAAPALPPRSPAMSAVPSQASLEAEAQPQEPSAESVPAQDWLTGSEDVLIDTAPSPISAEQARMPPPKPSVPKPKPGRLSRVWPDPVSGGTATMTKNLPPPKRRPPGAMSPGEGTGMKKPSGIPGRLKPPAWVLEQQKSASEPALASSRPSPPLPRQGSFDLGIQPEDAADLALTEGQSASQAHNEAKMSVTPASRPIKAPSWDSPDTSVEMGKLAPPLAPSPGPRSPHLQGKIAPSPSPPPLPEVVLSPEPSVGGLSPLSPASPEPPSSLGKNRLSHLINAANEREGSRSITSLSAPRGAPVSRSWSAGLPPPSNKEELNATARSSPAPTGDTPAPRSVAELMRELELSKAEAAAKRQGQPVRATTLPRSVYAQGIPATLPSSEPASERSSLSTASAPPAAPARAKPRVSAKPSSLLPSASTKPTTPWEREAAESDRGTSQDHQESFKGVNHLISRWQGGSA